MPGMDSTLSASHALLKSRVWFISLMVLQALALGLVAAGVFPKPAKPYLFFAAWYLVISMPLNFGVVLYVRSQCYKAHWVKDAIKPQGYLGAQIRIAGLLTVQSCLASFFIIFHQNYILGTIPVVVSLLLMVLMFPDGKPMQDHPVRL